MDLSILIVNWRAAHYLRACLASVFKAAQEIEYEVIVLDNASYDRSAEIIRNEFPKVIFVQSDQNLGFIRGNNLAFCYAKGRNILLLNPDTEVIGDAITTMHSLLESLPRAGAIGARLVGADGSVQTNCVQAFPTICNQLLDTDYLRKVFPKSRLWGTESLYDDATAPAEVDMVCGACLMVKRAVFEVVGLLSLDYLMYGDDFDLCYKIKHAGYRVYHTNRASIIHYGGKSTDSWKLALADVWIKDSTYKFICKSRGRWYGNSYKASMLLVAICRLLMLASARLLLGRSRRVERIGNATAKWKRIFQWALGLKQWAKSAGREIGFSPNQW